MRQLKSLAKYLIRWQLSTPTLYLVVLWLGSGLFGTFMANLIGGLIFFKIDQKFVFGKKAMDEIFVIWHYKQGTCDYCGWNGELRRLVKVGNRYDRTTAEPLWLCPTCSHEKTEKLVSEGILTSQC